MRTSFLPVGRRGEQRRTGRGYVGLPATTAEDLKLYSSSFTRRGGNPVEGGCTDSRVGTPAAGGRTEGNRTPLLVLLQLMLLLLNTEAAAKVAGSVAVSGCVYREEEGGGREEGEEEEEICNEERQAPRG